MQHLLVTGIAKKWNISERSVRNYCTNNRVEGVFITGKTWNIAENAEKPERSKMLQMLSIRLSVIGKAKG